MEIRVPSPDGADSQEVEVGRWLVEDGEQVEAGQPLLDVLFDKADVTVEAPATGILRHRAGAGDVLEPHGLLGLVEPL